MRIAARIGRDAVEWLEAHRAELPAFWSRLEQIRADERSMLLHTDPIKEPDYPHMLRCFRFGNGCIAVLAWDVSRNRLRVERCRRVKPGSD